MLVDTASFKSIIYKLAMPGTYSLDVESTGLMAYHKDELFSIIIADENESYYFNFLRYEEMEEDQIIPREWLKQFSLAFKNPTSVWYMHNAKFDLSMLARENLFIAGTIHCTQAIARVEYNGHLKYSLSACAERIGEKKDDAVEKWISKEKAYKWQVLPGKKQRSKDKFYSKVPFNIIHPYGEQDARVTYKLGNHQVAAITELSKGKKVGPLQVMENERRFTKTCFNIERTGVLIDKKYCEEAGKFEKQNMEKAAVEFKRLTGKPLVNSAKELAPIFKELGEVFPQTEKGNDSFDKSVLDTFKTPAAAAVKEFRKAEKRASYFYSYLYYADQGGVIHADIKQSGTESGRVSYGNPNFQNVPKRGEDNSPFPVRRSIIPRPGFVLYDLDFMAQEYRLMVDYAGEKELAEKINSGLDVHVACQQMLGLKDRNTAKTMNFMKLYGGGAQKLADSLEISLEEARALSMKYWNNLPHVTRFIKDVARTAEVRGYIINWFGRVLHFPNPKFAYAAPNHLIQGGCADVVKVAMNKIGGYLADKKSRMLLQVHDSILFEIHESELSIVSEIKHIMETVYPYKLVPLLCDVSWSNKSWGDLQHGEETRDQFSAKSDSGVKTA